VSAVPDPALVAQALDIEAIIYDKRPDLVQSYLDDHADALKWRSVFTTCQTCEGGRFQPLPPFDGTVERTSTPCSDCRGVGVVPTDRLRNAWREWAQQADLELKYFVAALASEEDTE